ncbi:MAG: cytochrome P450 [Xenococcaceae cyanobacterium MO_188.B29]|nr:cytochrome P450 [Xenococcaceae cyanobacterium MO_188.B29]
MTKLNKAAYLNHNNSSTQPPGPRGLSLLSSLVEYTFTPIEFLLKSAREYGDVVSLSIGPIRTYLFNHPDLIDEVLNKQNQNCIKDISYRALKGVFGDGLLLSDGDFWKRHRRMIQPAFTAERIAGYASTIVADTSQMLAKWRSGEIYDIHQEMSQLTIKLITQTMFGVDVTETALEILEALDTIMLHYIHQTKTWFLLPAWLPTPENRQAHRATKRLNEIVYGIIEQRRKSPKDDLLSRMLQVKDEDGSQLSDRQLRDEVITLMLAGYETTTNALTWTLMLLAQNPEAEAKLVAEVRSVLEERLPTINDLPKLCYTEMVLKESMRLYPPAWIVGRELTRDCTIGDYYLARGTTIYLSQWVVHRDPRFFANPEQFLPERWEDNLEQRLPRCAYFPFGAGPRVCIGKAFSMMEATLILAMVAQKFRLTLIPDQSIELLPSITLRPKHGVKMMFKEISF